MANLSPNVAIITLNVNVLNTPIKKTRIKEVDLKRESTDYTVYKKLTSSVMIQVGRTKGNAK